MPTTSGDLRLGDGARVGVVGGGPSGAFFAHFAAREAERRGLAAEIAIFDGKSFARRGPAGCNMGAGVVSESLTRLLRAEGIELPEERIQRRIQGYRLYTRGSTIDLAGPGGPREISAVFRGAGPRFSAFSYNVSFDDFLLQRVVAGSRGRIQVIPEPVEQIVLPARAGGPIELRSGRGRQQVARPFDLVVGAFGLNTVMLQKVVALGFGYRPPPTVRACQTELSLDPAYIRDVLGDAVHTFVLGLEGIRFGALTPKESHVTVSVVGKGDMGLPELQRFLAHPVVRSVLPAGWDASTPSCFCFPRISVGAATRPFADRFVLVGDAAYCRFYKNGFESAFLTARLAAEAAFRQGVSAGAFARGYLGQAQPLIRDNFYGRLLFDLNDLISRHELLTETRRRLLEGDAATRALLHEILWGMLTGSLPYRQIALLALTPRLLLRTAASLAGVALSRAHRPIARTLRWGQ